ncbi:MAG: hypothetical protein E6Q97_23480 [Desulfurellales bacterium]|nr:MAG: hypothetical protein E6Q97_23480 [Desulfurellales bacterium]
MSAPSADSTRDFITALRWLADHPGDLAWRRRACEAMRTAADSIEASSSYLLRDHPPAVTIAADQPQVAVDIDGRELWPGIVGVGRAVPVDETGCVFRGEAWNNGRRVLVQLKFQQNPFGRKTDLPIIPLGTPL